MAVTPPISQFQPNPNPYGSISTTTRGASLLGVDRRPLVDLTAEHDHRNRAVTLLHALQHLPAVDARHHDVQQHQVGCAPFDRVERLVRARGLANRVSLHLEVDPHVLAEARVVVDHEDERACGGAARA